MSKEGLLPTNDSRCYLTVTFSVYPIFYYINVKASPNVSLTSFKEMKKCMQKIKFLFFKYL